MTSPTPCPPGQHEMPDGTCMDDAEMMPEMTGGTPWWAAIVVEGEWSGDGRQWAPDALDWAAPPLSAKWQPAEAPGHDGSVVVARVDGLTRVGPQIIGWGVFDDQGEYGAEALRLVEGGFLQGMSIKADDFEAEDVELIWPAGDAVEDGEMADDEQEMANDAATFHLPGKHNQKDHGGSKAPPKYDRSRPPGTARRKYSGGDGEGKPMMPDMPMEEPPMHPPATPREIYHKGRIRSVTLLPEPAFADCRIHLGPPPPEVLTAAAIGGHSTETSTGSWDGPANEKRLPSPMSEATARAAYAWLDDDAIQDGQVTKAAARFLHHEVSADGSPGPANLTACSTGIGVLNGGRGGTIIPPDGKRGVWNHLAGHLRDADREPPPLEAATGPTTVTAAGYTITIPDVWPESWFDKPTEPPPFGALHVTAQGRVYGYLGPDRVAHRAFRASGRRVTIPRGTDYSEFLNKPCLVAGADGHTYRINAGNITMGCSHPAPDDPRRADPRWAIQQYDNTCSIVARVRVGEDDHGVWVAGALLHGIEPDAIERMMACALSGDWQNGRLNAALLVPVEGFPTPVQGTMRVREGAVVASMTPVRFAPDTPSADLRPLLERLARSINRDSASRMSELAARINR